jgi:hypothetical protein
MTLTKEQRQDMMAKAREARKAKKAAGTALLNQTTPLASDGIPAVTSSPRGEVIPSNGSGHKPPGYEGFNATVESPDIVSKSFSTAEITSGLKLLGAPGKDIQDIPILADFPDRQYLVACARVISRCRIYDDKEGEAEILYIVTGLCGIGGKRADLIVRAIIGDTSTTHGIQGSWGKFKDKFKQKVQDGQGE